MTRSKTKVIYSILVLIITNSTHNNNKVFTFKKYEKKNVYAGGLYTFVGRMDPQFLIMRMCIHINKFKCVENTLYCLFCIKKCNTYTIINRFACVIKIMPTLI